MKRLIVLVIVVVMASVTSVQAQSWLDALKSAATTAIDKATGGKLTAATIYGTWRYSHPGIKLSSSQSALSDITAAAATTSIQQKMATYYEKVGIKSGACSFAFKEDGTFTSTFGQRTSGGHFTFNAETNQLTLKYETGILKLGAINAYAYMTGGDLQILFPMDNLLKVLMSLGSASGTLSTITSLLKNYDSVKIGFEFSK